MEAMRSDARSTPLDSAAYNDHTSIVGVLLEGEGGQILCLRDDNESTPLDSAAYKGHAAVVRILLDNGANVEATRSDDGSTALYNSS